MWISSFYFLKGQHLILHKTCGLSIPILINYKMTFSSPTFSCWDLALPRSSLLPLQPLVYVYYSEHQVEVNKLLKKARLMKEILLLLSECWPESTVICFTLGGQVIVCQPMYGNTYSKWARLIGILNCLGANIFKTLWNKKGTILILLLKLILMNSMTWTQTMKNTGILHQITNVTRADWWQIVTYWKANLNQLLSCCFWISHLLWKIVVWF